MGSNCALFVVSVLTLLLLGPDGIAAQDIKPNIVFIYGDDISPREIRAYKAPTWSGPKNVRSKDPEFLAETPMLDKFAKNGVYFTKAWAAPVCSPSRAMLLTGRFATMTKWWYNRDYGSYVDSDGKKKPIVPLYVTSPILLGHLAQKAGYKTLWAGKPGMKDADLTEFGFDEGVFVPNPSIDEPSPYSSFRVGKVTRKNGTKRFVNMDSGKEVKESSGSERSFFWKPHIQLMNFPGVKEDFTIWPHSELSRRKYGTSTYGPDVEANLIKRFMVRSKNQKKPFFVFHNSKLGHKAFNFLNPKEENVWPPTPKLKWIAKERRYLKSKVIIKGSKGKYSATGINSGGLHRHIEYLDYMIWKYVEQLKKLGTLKNTIFVFAGDNGTSDWGKHVGKKQRGPHIPFLIWAPGLKFTKKGRQDVLMHVVDMLPTFADMMGIPEALKKPKPYKTHGKSLWPYLTREIQVHRRYVYSYIGGSQIIRGKLVMRDADKSWWKVDEEVDDYDSYPRIRNWGSLPRKYREEREYLRRVLKNFDVYDTEHDYEGPV
uniref:Sulfatase N-terminal domain-containing protein n=1 Tax=Rhodosorus marinus TaxID=101924 RepID=A0A7S3A3T8_9RHOD|mmetsp:Transcript_43729/g.171111  ORF Transcript_43729/g.171111 Transcript_43729/m.171111 type:complete len:542 (+) Transcript_43729:699-2324(+)|eukprot:CAMPEP_0113968556 /NCGR_PEP_ID=MMETSP0011_2-20120614/9617_1 /TAXON_ID=101924 /ORGANISM="Rhodosorus marinus" /LENGTH=541 /DNA_ID=CAMNT_0000981695 /DNA_START=273 /DNA_END=1898 /DNA_ORIENTATION=+ /assembly_acc=CAM_ASM_000156